MEAEDGERPTSRLRDFSDSMAGGWVQEEEFDDDTRDAIQTKRVLLWK